MIEEIDKTYQQIENKILNHEIYQNVKDYSKAKEKIKTYLEVGELLKNVDTKYGKNVIEDYSKRLTNKFGKKYTSSLLYKIKQFYNIIEKVPTLSGKLTWSHWYEMLSFDDINKIEYYVNHNDHKKNYSLPVRANLLVLLRLVPLGDLYWAHHYIVYGKYTKNKRDILDLTKRDLRSAIGIKAENYKVPGKKARERAINLVELLMTSVVNADSKMPVYDVEEAFKQL